MPNRQQTIRSKRLFFALWPDDHTRQQIASLCTQLNADTCKPTKAENIHITLAFLGQVDETTEQTLIQQIEHLSAPRLQLTFDQLKLWRKPQILCLTSAHPNQNLLQLNLQIKQICQACGIVLEDRPYKAHITLARKAKKKLNTQAISINWRAHSFSLIESINTRNGPVYRLIRTWSLY